MENVLPLRVPLVVQVKTGKTWGALKKMASGNPEGGSLEVPKQHVHDSQENSGIEEFSSFFARPTQSTEQGVASASAYSPNQSDATSTSKARSLARATSDNQDNMYIHTSVRSLTVAMQRPLDDLPQFMQTNDSNKDNDDDDLEDLDDSTSL
jgi:hypothetical protein